MSFRYFLNFNCIFLFQSVGNCFCSYKLRTESSIPWGSNRNVNPVEYFKYNKFKIELYTITIACELLTFQGAVLWARDTPVTNIQEKAVSELFLVAVLKALEKRIDFYNKDLLKMWTFKWKRQNWTFIKSSTRPFTRLIQVESFSLKAPFIAR